MKKAEVPVACDFPKDRLTPMSETSACIQRHSCDGCTAVAIKKFSASKMMRLSTEVLGDMQASMKPTLPEFDAGRRLSVVSIALRSFERKNKSAKQRKTLRRVAHRSGQETNNQNTK